MERNERGDIALLYSEMKIVKILLRNHLIAVTFNCIRTSVLRSLHAIGGGFRKRIRLENKTLGTIIFISIIQNFYSQKKINFISISVT